MTGVTLHIILLHGVVSPEVVDAEETYAYKVSPDMSLNDAARQLGVRPYFFFFTTLQTEVE